MFGLQEVSDTDRNKMGQEIVSELKDFLPELQVLEERLKNISGTSKFRQYPRSNTPGKTLRKCLTNLFTGLNKRRSVFNIASKPLNLETTKEQSFVSKKDAIQSEITQLKTCMESASSTPCRKGNHTDILNIYWYSKAELEIADNISSRLEYFDREIAKLEY